MFRYQKVMVTLDGSELAERALPLAQMLAQAMGAELVLLRVVGPLPVPVDLGLDEKMVGARREEAEAYLAAVADRLEDAPAVTTVTLVGPAAQRIVQYAQEHGVDLMVMSSHGRSGASRWVHGSVTTRILRHAPCSLAVVHVKDPPPHPLERVLLPLDGSAVAEVALAPAAAIAQALSARLVLLAVTFSLGEMAPALYQHHLEQIEKAEARQQQAYLGRVRASLADRNLAVDVAMTTGEAAEEILAYAERHAVDLIVLSSHGRSGLERWAFGSVAEKVVRAATCATLLVRGRVPGGDPAGTDA